MPLCVSARDSSDIRPRGSWLDGRHVVFGEVIEGYDVVEKIENAPKTPDDKPLATVKIAKSGELPIGEEGTHVEL